MMMMCVQNNESSSFFIRKSRLFNDLLNVTFMSHILVTMTLYAECGC